MRCIVCFIVLFSFLCLRGNAQGIEFSTYESETIQKTSYSVFDENPLTFKHDFTIAYDLAIHDYGSFGYIFRLKDSKNENSDIYSFVFSYDNNERSYLKFNIETKECLVADTLCNKNLGPRRWIPIKIFFSLKDDSVCLTINKRKYHAGKLGLPKEMTPSIMFGSSRFSEEIPSFAIRNLVVSDTYQQIEFPLNENAGTLVHDNQGKVRGKAINPVWLINRFYYWNLLHSQSSETTAGYNYDAQSGNFVYFNSDSLYTLDIRRSKWEGYKHEPFPMKMYLGTNFLHPDTHSAYIYEVDNRMDSCTICSLNILTGETNKVDTKFLSSQRHHHSSYLDTIQNKFYIFGGFGLRKYTNTLEVYDLNQKTWNTVKLKGDFVAPRFFSSMGALNPDELFLFGGTGNSSGDQSLGKIYYYDLYKINLQDSTVKKVRDYSYTGIQIVPVRNLILSDDKTAFYTLCYPMQEASSYLQLYKFSLQNDSYEVLGNSIPMDSKAILSNANLYYNKDTKELYCCTQEFDEHGGESSVTQFYSLSAPAIAKDALFLYSTEQNLSWYFAAIGGVAALVLFIGIGYYLKSRKVKQPISKVIRYKAHTPLDEERTSRANALYLFGEFTILDKKGRDITYLFSSKIKQLFLLTFLNTIGDKEGITSSYIYGLLWPEKDLSSAKNLKGVTINRLRKILDDLEGIELIYANSRYSIKLLDNFYCDYQRFLEQIDRMRQSNASQEVSQVLIGILSRGKFLKSVDDSMFDTFKSEQEDELHKMLMIEMNNLYAKATYEQAIQLAEIWLKVDPLNDMALWYMLNACHKLKREDQAMKKYYLYIAEYNKSMGNNYPYSYSDIIHNDLRISFQ
ncbi:Kelch repeat-containing protein [Bacteroides sp. UBA939]|uniref:Kelch repeat-containing protein n=1 Tax=Bacteroides sp. UBA939 TaxID=1946092 RepID=UPI0025C0B463|nr:kelch repeat-containing protein [Bacteroides sp. UBA939]